MSTPTHPERFHALDATRAYALMLGVVFHASWSFVPSSMGAPVVDASASGFFDWFFFTSHTFRMQLFFLIAGFFAHMVCHRKGFAYFTLNRLSRIGVPMLLGWLLLFPLIQMAWTIGGNVSGRSFQETSIAELFSMLYREGLILVAKDSGGRFSLGHLWFLYYLLCLYALVLGLRWLLTRSDSMAQRLRFTGDRLVRQAMASPSSIVWLAVCMGLFLWRMGGWFGVDTPLGTLIPSIPVLLLYGSFFSFGWLLHRQPALIEGLGNRWRWQLPVGIALSIPLFAVYQTIREQGIGNDVHPRLSPTQIVDWPPFIDRLQSAEKSSEAPVELANLWKHIPEGTRQKILALSPKDSADKRTAVSQAINKLLTQPALFKDEPITVESKPSPDEADRVLRQNRAILEQLFPGMIAGNPGDLSWYRPAKLAYSVVYGLVMWLLLMGTLGFFQACFSGHSPGWRYVADSSYWIYLMHLPLVAALQVWMGPWAWPGAIKFLVLNLVAFVILFASYHYLARSTWIGRMLNGRAYPFVAWPFRRTGD